MQRRHRWLLAMAAAAALLVVYLAVQGAAPALPDLVDLTPQPAATSLPRASADVPLGQSARNPLVLRDPEPPTVAEGRDDAVGTGGEAEALIDLRARRLILPVAGAGPSDLVQSFHEARGARTHEAIDILAPRHTPVLAVEDGRIARLFASERGGLTIYHFDPTERYCYYYAHLESYAPGLEEGMPVVQGQQIGTVGTSGNAPADTPHLHFAIFELGPERRWWEGRPLDPYLVLR